jgi:hypothetical protein
MINDMHTLEEYGIEGAPESEPEVVSLITKLILLL